MLDWITDHSPRWLRDPSHLVPKPVKEVHYKVRRVQGPKGGFSVFK